MMCERCKATMKVIAVEVYRCEKFKEFRCPICNRMQHKLEMEENPYELSTMRKTNEIKAYGQGNDKNRLFLGM